MHPDGQTQDAPSDGAVLRPLCEVTRREGLVSLTARLLDLKAWLASDLAAFEAPFWLSRPSSLEDRGWTRASGSAGPRTTF